MQIRDKWWNNIEKYPSINFIIIFYFENVAFLYAKLGSEVSPGSDVCPRVDNQTSSDTSQDLTWPLSGKIAIS